MFLSLFKILLSFFLKQYLFCSIKRKFKKVKGRNLTPRSHRIKKNIKKLFYLEDLSTILNILVTNNIQHRSELENILLKKKNLIGDQYYKKLFADARWSRRSETKKQKAKKQQKTLILLLRIIKMRGVYWSYRYMFTHNTLKQNS